SLILLLSLSSFYSYPAHRNLPSFPTRRSSDLLGFWNPPPDKEERGDRDRCVEQKNTRSSKQVNQRKECQSNQECPAPKGDGSDRSEEHTSELQSRFDLVCRLLLEKKKKNRNKF